MTTSFHAVSGRRKLAPGDSGKPADHEGQAGHYLTDGVNLYRFLGYIAGRAGRLAGIENWHMHLVAGAARLDRDTEQRVRPEHRDGGLQMRCAHLTANG